MNPGVRLRVGHQQSRFFADSDLFRGLLLTIFGPQSDSMVVEPTRCAYMSVINTRSFGQFWPIRMTHRFGALEQFPRLTNPECGYVSVINTHNFGQF